MPSLPALKKLSFERNFLKDLKGLPDFPLLRELEINEPDLVSLNGFPKLRCLEKLRIGSTRGDRLTYDRMKVSSPLPSRGHRDDEEGDRSMKHLPSLDNLESIDLSYSYFNSLSGIPPLPKLRHIDITGTNITDLKPIKTGRGSIQITQGKEKSFKTNEEGRENKSPIEKAPSSSCKQVSVTPPPPSTR